MSGTPILEVDSLRKRYGRRQVLDGIRFELHAGEILGFLGANGAGKSTTIRILLSLVFPDSGSFRILDQHFPGGKRSVYGRVGALVEGAELFEHLSAWENLRMLGGMQGVRDPGRLEEVLRWVGLYDRRKDKVGGFSQGMRQRLGLAQAILHQPELLILDEPTTGLDPAGMREMREGIRSLAKESGMAVLFSSHILREVELLADRVQIINLGHMVAEGRLEDLFEHLPYRLVEVRSARAGEIADWLRARPGLEVLNRQEERLLLKVHRGQAPELAELPQLLFREGFPLAEFRAADSLEDLFLDRTESGEMGR